jgi:spore coat polysaccharide biosynthesis protein SpsF
VNALVSHTDDTLVFRLTADNIFPDGHLLDEIETDFMNRELDYLVCNGEGSGLPYGASVELMRLGNLREAATKTTASHDREHVTPYLQRQFGTTHFEKYKATRRGHFRCTVDCFDDYVGIQQVFADVDDPVEAPLSVLTKNLEHVDFQPFMDKPAKKLVLGSVQLGMPYGIDDTVQQPTFQTSEQLIKKAIGNGILHIDTARAYGSSESVIGDALKGGWRSRVDVITKLSPLADCPDDASDACVSAFVDASIFQSLSALRMDTLDVLMLHRAAHLFKWNGAAWRRLLELKNLGIITQLGASVQSPDELMEVMQVSDISFVQLPTNILDWRWDRVVPSVLEIKRSRSFVVHVRSSLLKGLLPSKQVAHWNTANVQDPHHVITWLEEQVHLLKKSSIADLCLSYVNSLPWVDGIVVGMETVAQLVANVTYLHQPPLTDEQVLGISNDRPKLGEATLNPSQWEALT